jgi:hypothetical protein
MHTTDFRFPGVLNSKDLLIAEAIQARAWEALATAEAIPPTQIEQAKAKLGRIVVKLMVAGGPSLGNLASEAVRTFKESPDAQDGEAVQAHS